VKRLRVNINGSPINSLIAKADYARRLNRDLIQAMANCAPHGRDYQTCEDPQLDFELDRDEFKHHLKLLKQVQEYLEASVENIATQKQKD
jgi:hypothetical protein